jgi:hypothetical protein
VCTIWEYGHTGIISAFPKQVHWALNRQSCGDFIPLL